MVKKVPLENKDRLKELINDDGLYEKLFVDAELFEGLISPLDMDQVMADK